MACKSASGLGKEALKSEVAGYIGFTDGFHVIPTAANTIGYCFLSGLRGIIIDRKSASDAIKEVEQEVDLVIQKIRSHKKIQPITRNRVITALRHNLDCMVCLGDSNWKIDGH
ncbi:MAG: hypothetical protein GY757_45240 [bacterium]|nr:hypothetical protein [bacterium]